MVFSLPHWRWAKVEAMGGICNSTNKEKGGGDEAARARSMLKEKGINVKLPVGPKWDNFKIKNNDWE